MAPKSLRLAAVVAAFALVGGALVAVSPAAQAKACGKVKFAEPASDSASRTEVPGLKTVKITDKYTEKKPYVFEYSHGPAFWLPADPNGTNPQGQAAVVEDTKWFGIQVDTAKPYKGLYLRLDWTPVPGIDLDMYVWDRNGSEAGRSADWNYPQPVPINSGQGGPGYEQLLGLGVQDCTALAIESRAFTTPPLPSVTLKVWLGPIR